MSRVLLGLLLCLPVYGAGGWLQLKLGAFTVYTDAGAKEGQTRLAELEQFRYSLGVLLGMPEMTVHPSLTVFVEPGARAGLMPMETRTGGLGLTVPPGSLDASVKAALAKILIDQNIGQLDPGLEAGLTTFLSTTQVTGAHVVWGAPPEAALRTPDWVLVHWLITNAATFSSVRAWLGNLRNGVAEEVAYRNSLGMTREHAVQEAAAHPVSATIDAPSRPLSPERDLLFKPVPPDVLELARADQLDEGSAGRYRQMLSGGVHAVEAEEGLSMLAARNGDSREAEELLDAAIHHGSKNPRALVNYARIEKDPEKARKALERAIAIDPGWAEAHFLLGGKQTDSGLKVAEWNRAAALAPRTQAYWVALAQELVAEKKWGEASKAWQGAERAAASPAERQKMLNARLSIEAQRLDYEETQRAREAAAKQADIDRLKAEAIAEVRAAERKGSDGGVKPGTDVVAWEDMNKAAAQIDGVLVRVDCAKKPGQLTVRGNDGKVLRLNADIAALQLNCGAQAERRVHIDFNARAGGRGGVAGDTIAIAFH